MKINLVYFDFDDKDNPLLGAGQAKATYEVCRRLVKRGFTPIVYCSRYPNSKDRLEEGIYYKHIGLGSPLLRLNNLVYLLLAPIYATKVAADIVVECFTAPVTTLSLPLFVNKNIPIVAIPTSFEAERFSKKYHFPFVRLQNHNLKYYRYFLPYSQHFVDLMAKFNNNFDYQIVGQGVDKSYLKHKPNMYPKHILFLGRFDIGQKGIDLLLEAFAKINEKIDMPLLIVGGGPDIQKIKELVGKHKLSGMVKLVGPSYGQKKIKFLKQSLFTVVPSRHEGFCIFALESLALGIPVVTFDIPGLKWITSKVSLKAKSISSDDLAQTMLKAYKKYSEDRGSEACKRLAQKYSWDNVASEYDSYFKKVIAKHAEK